MNDNINHEQNPLDDILDKKASEAAAPCVEWVSSITALAKNTEEKKTTHIFQYSAVVATLAAACILVALLMRPSVVEKSIIFQPVEVSLVEIIDTDYSSIVYEEEGTTVVWLAPMSE